jgi:hypothetical protein
VEVALYDRLEPCAGLGHGIMHALAKLLLHRSPLGTERLHTVLSSKRGAWRKAHPPREPGALAEELDPEG